ncbi:TniQ family protein [Variovorax sp. RB3P1]|uniref:TniQ family protein n=1 Tax=Variovorax sp. RB3P1 TaxID=3443732 RepID=UPI003F48FC9F
MKLGFLPALEPDETLYSFCAAVHLMNGRVNCEETSLALLGVRHGVRQHDFPAGITRLPLGGERVIFDSLEIARHHTIAGYYLPFVADASKRTIAAALDGGATQHARRMFDGSSRTLRPEHPLKFCRQCVRADFAEVGRPYWHVSHQFPTTWTCSIHGSTLVVIHGRSKRWLIPGESAAQADPEQHSSRGADLLLTSIGEALRGVTNIDMHTLRLATQARLCQLGVMHASARSIRHSRLANWFKSTRTSERLSRGPKWAASLADGEWVAGQLWRHKRTHAVRWVVLWSALGWPDAPAAAQSFRDAAHGRQLDEARQIALFKTALPAVGTPPYVVDAFAQAGSYGEVMSMLRASRADVVRWLEADPNLRRSWRARLKEEKLGTVVQALRAEITLHPRHSRQEVERNCGAEMRWLREHAPDQLRKILTQVPSRSERQLVLFDPTSHEMSA